MQDRVLHAADVLVDVHPVVRLFDVPAGLVVLVVAVAQLIPGRIEEGIHRVDFPLGRLAAARADRVDERLGRRDGRFALTGKDDVGRQQYGQVLFLFGDPAASLAVDHGDGRAPVALAGDQPVAQLVVDLRRRESGRFEVLLHGLDRLAVVHAVILAGVDDGAVGYERLFQIVDVDAFDVRVDDGNDG